jgi:WD40 repeat protein
MLLASGGGSFDKKGRNIPGEIILWDLSTGKEQGRLEGHEGIVFSLQFCSDRILASGSNDDTVRLWDVQNHRQQTKLQGHKGYVSSLAWKYAGNLLASGANDGTVKFWSMDRSERPGFSISSPVTGVAFSGLNTVVVGDADGRLGLLDTDTDSLRASVQAHEASVTTIVATPDGRLVASACDGTNFAGQPIDSEIKLWRLR